MCSYVFFSGIGEALETFFNQENLALESSPTFKAINEETQRFLSINKKHLRSKSKKKKNPIEKSNYGKQLSPEQLVLVLENLLDAPRVHWRTVAQVGADYDIESAANADVAHR